MSNTTIARTTESSRHHTLDDSAVDTATQPTQPAVATDTPRLSLSGTAIAAGAMTATTSAMIGSHLGALGTLAGAAAGSVIGAVLSALYGFGLQRARHALSTVSPAKPGLPTVPSDPSITSMPSASRPSPRGAMFSRRSVKVTVGVLITAALAFGVTVLVITGFERFTGGSLAGVQGATTIQHVSRSADQGPTQAAEESQPQGGEVAPVPASSSPSATATATPTPTPAASPSPTAQPTDATPEPRASSTPTSVTSQPPSSGTSAPTD